MKIAFLGSSEFSKIVLEKLLSSHYKVVCCVSNLDKETGRGHKIVFSPVKEFCLKNNIPLFQYKSVSKEGYDDIKSLNPDILVTASFGQILRQNILDLAPKGVINVHSSLLPKYRGSCPVNWAIINGETKTGITIMKTDIGLDTGDMILKKEVDILQNETAGELLLRLASIGADLLIKALNKIENGTAAFTKQDDSKSSYFPMLDKFTGKIDFNKKPFQIVNLCRGLNPWPLCFIGDSSEKIKVYSAKEYFLSKEENFDKYGIGQVVIASSKKGLILKCNGGYVLLDVIQAPNTKVMSSKAFLNGRSIEVGKQY